MVAELAFSRSKNADFIDNTREAPNLPHIKYCPHILDNIKVNFSFIVNNKAICLITYSRF